MTDKQQRLSHEGRCTTERKVRRRARGLSGGALSVLDVVLEYTLGMGRITDRLSMERIAAEAAQPGEALSVDTVRRGLRTLSEAAVIEHRAGSGRGWRNFTQITVTLTEAEIAALSESDSALVKGGSSATVEAVKGGKSATLSDIKGGKNANPKGCSSATPKGCSSATHPNRESPAGGLSSTEEPVVTNARTSQSVGAEFADAARAVEAEPVEAEIIEAELVDDDQPFQTGSVNGQAAKTTSHAQPESASTADPVFGQFSAELTNRAEHAEAAKALIDRLCQIAEAVDAPTGMQPYRISAASRRKLRGTVSEALGDGRSREVLAVAFGSWLVASGGSGLEGSLTWRIGEAVNMLNQHPEAAQRGPEALVGLGAGWGRQKAQQAAQSPAERRAAGAEAERQRRQRLYAAASALGEELGIKASDALSLLDPAGNRIPVAS